MGETDTAAEPGTASGTGTEPGAGAGPGTGASGKSLDPFLAGLDYPMFVVTAIHRDTGERAGCLIGFASQCGIDPGRFVVWLSRENHTHRVALGSSVLAVHSLSADQHDLAVLFGTRTGDREDKFAGCDWRPGPAGVPVLARCRGWFAGRVLDRAAWGDHTGFLLAPLAVTAADDSPPLMFSMVRDLPAGHPA